MELKGHTIGFKGEYSATVLKADGTVKEFLNKEKTLRSGDVIKNLLLDNFFTRLVSVESPLWWAASASIRCGTGSQAVAVGQTGLENPLSLLNGSWPGTNGVNSPTVIENGFIKLSKVYTFTFNIGQISGNISELGVNFSGTEGNTVESRALVVDNQGLPTAITVTSNEQLILTYTLRAEYSADDVVTNSTFLLNGNPVDVVITARWTGANEHTLERVTASGFFGNQQPVKVYNGSLNGINENPSGDSLSTSSSYTAQYNVAGGKEFTYTMSISQGNLSGGISVISGDIGSGCKIKFGFNPPLPKNADRALSITVRQTFSRLP